MRDLVTPLYMGVLFLIQPLLLLVVVLVAMEGPILLAAAAALAPPPPQQQPPPQQPHSVGRIFCRKKRILVTISKSREQHFANRDVFFF